MYPALPTISASVATNITVVFNGSTRWRVTVLVESISLMRFVGIGFAH